MQPQPAQKRPLEFAFTTNRAFLHFSLVTITSVIESADRECRFHLVHDGEIDQRCQKKISEYVSQKGAEVAFHDVPENFPREFSEHSKWDAAAIYRLALAESLPESVDRVIYLDSDILVRRSLGELMRWELGPSGLGAVAQGSESVRRLGLPKHSTYFNSGMMVIDLAVWRKNATTAQLLDLVMQQPERWLYADQDILAVHFRGEWTRIPPEYNVTHRFFDGPKSVPLPTDDPFVVHYSGQGRKPWQTYQPLPFDDEYWATADSVRAAGFDLPERPRKALRWYRRGPVRALRNRRLQRRQRRRDREQQQLRRRIEYSRATNRQMVQRHIPDLVVKRGPFTGMKYPKAYAHGSALAPKLLGTYEAELQPIIEQLLKRDYRTIIDIGGAEGYYAVGCAMRWPQAEVHAYEIGLEARTAIGEMASANGVDTRVRIEAECIFGDLYQRRALVICDIEGGEEELLINDQASEALSDSDWLIEVHDNFRAGLSEKLMAQFSRTHNVNVVHSVLDEDRPKHWSLEELQGLSPQRQSSVLAERRGGPMKWMICHSRTPFPSRQTGTTRAA